MTESKICTCPSGDGSLRWPCPAHPAEQAGGDERAAFKTAYLAEFDCDADGDDNMAHSNTARRAWKMARAALAHDEQEQAAHEIRLLANALGECIQAAGITAPGVPLTGPQLLMFAEDLKRDLQRAALAQPSPAQAEQHWQKLEKPAQVGAIRFRAGLSSRLVVEAAQRLYEFESTPEKEAERIERLQAFREQCFEPLGAEFSKVLSENLVELSSDAKPEQADEKPGDSILCYGCFAKGVGPDHFDEAGKCLAAQAEAERPEVVARVVHSNPVVLGQCGPLNANDELMTVAQHAASVARWAEMFNRVEQQRDSALARVAELELGIARIAGDFLPDNCGQAELALDEMRQALHELLAAPPTQAQHSVPEGWRIERSAERIVVMNLKNGAGYAAARDGESGIAESVLYLLAADLLAAAPGKEGV